MHIIFSSIESPKVLRDLMKSWVGWELPTRNLIIEVVTSSYPVASPASSNGNSPATTGLHLIPLYHLNWC